MFRPDWLGPALIVLLMCHGCAARPDKPVQAAASSPQSVGLIVQAQPYFDEDKLITTDNVDEGARRESLFERVGEHDYEYVLLRNKPDYFWIQSVVRLEVGRILPKSPDLVSLELCTAFWIDPQHLLTALHCLGARDDAPEFIWASTDYYRDSQAMTSHLPPNRIALEIAERGAANDWAILRVSDPQLRQKRYAVELGIGRAYENGFEPHQSTAYLLSHPLGTLLKITSRGCRVATEASFANILLHNCYTDSGSSGAPLFDAQGRAVAIHIAKSRTLFEIAEEFNDDGVQRSVLRASHPDLVEAARFPDSLELTKIAETASLRPELKARYSTAISLRSVYEQSVLFRNIVHSRYSYFSTVASQAQSDAIPIGTGSAPDVVLSQNECPLLRPESLSWDRVKQPKSLYMSDVAFVSDEYSTRDTYRLSFVDNWNWSYSSDKSGKIEKRAISVKNYEFSDNDPESPLENSDRFYSITSDTPIFYANLFSMPSIPNGLKNSEIGFGLTSDFDIPSPFEGYKSSCLAVEFRCVANENCFSKLRITEARQDDGERQTIPDGKRNMYEELVFDGAPLTIDTSTTSSFVMLMTESSAIDVLQRLQIPYWDYRDETQ